MVWSMAPVNSNGATIIDSRLIPPFFKRHSSTNDRAIEKVESKATDIFDKVLEEAKEVIADARINKNMDSSSSSHLNHLLFFYVPKMNSTFLILL